ncbi:AraC family transcriptional regulator [Pantoea cypripedii]|uniref:AraC family transcriptional regulator n=1 Tax=Pantoea cypripedii TaxID=55209 RepID=A0A6B9GC26_PANCY|nr:AraC family transcriptional regulator [Pantoea cypripedii]QGY32920.1 AraC family transcriptional regulator [Pantoea cypripedii]
MDPLSDVLSLLKLRSYVSGGFDAGGEWAVQFGAHRGIKFHAVITGRCWVFVEGEPQPVQVHEGECFLLARGLPFCLASDMSVAPVDISTLLPRVQDGRIVTYNQGGEFLSIGGYFTLSESHSDLLLDMLPPLLIIRDEPSTSTLRWCLEQMRQEIRDPKPGGDIVAQQLATMVLVRALRLQLSVNQGNALGWLFGLSDKRIRAAINVMHERPGSNWTVQNLAKEAAMSRTAFALRFKQLVGLSPIDYLTRWRMTLASNRLVRSDDSISAISSELGYESEKSFSAAFKRIMKLPPRQYAALARCRASTTGES